MFLAPGSIGRIGDPHAPGQGFAFANTEAAALVARFTTAPTTSRKRAIDTLIGALKTAGVWSKLDALYLMAAADSQAARRNWVQDLYNLTAVSSPTFTADRGYTGDGAAAYLDTGFNGTTAASPLLTQNSAHASGWNLSNRAANLASLMGARESTTKYIDIAPYITGNLYIARMTAGNAAISTANAGSQGMFSVNRSASNALQGYKNGSSLGTSSQTSVGVPNSNITLLARSLTSGSPDAFSADQISMASFGSSLSAGEEASMYSAVLTYLQTVGAA